MSQFVRQPLLSIGARFDRQEQMVATHRCTAGAHNDCRLLLGAW
jgi:hypothetical protein